MERLGNAKRGVVEYFETLSERLDEKVDVNEFLGDILWKAGGTLFFGFLAATELGYIPETIGKPIAISYGVVGCAGVFMKEVGAYMKNRQIGPENSDSAIQEDFS